MADNIITPFKGRTLDTTKYLEVYRNLHKKGRVYSIRQNGLVVAHTTAICLSNVEFIVNSSGKKKAIKTMERNVHAYIKGGYQTHALGRTAKDNTLPIEVKYNPFNDLGFYAANKKKKVELTGAKCCIINQDGVRAAYAY